MPRLSNNAELPLPNAAFVAAFWPRFQRANIVPPGLTVPCMEWTRAHTKRGYGSVSYLGRVRRVSRIAWAIIYGKWPPNDMQVCHHCDNPPCGEYTHLFLGTQKDNHNDSRVKGRWSPPPHPIGEQHHAAKLTDHDVVTIRRLHAEGMRQVEIAEQFGLSQAAVSSITRGKLWSSVDGVLTRHEIVRYDFDGSEVSIKALASKYGLPYSSLRKRLEKGWDLNRAINQPIKKDYRRCSSPI
jgi:HNH endonuclease